MGRYTSRAPCRNTREHKQHHTSIALTSYCATSRRIRRPPQRGQGPPTRILLLHAKFSTAPPFLLLRVKSCASDEWTEACCGTSSRIAQSRQSLPSSYSKGIQNDTPLVASSWVVLLWAFVQPKRLEIGCHRQLKLTRQDL